MRGNWGRNAKEIQEEMQEEWLVRPPIGITITLRMSSSIKASAHQYIHFNTAVHCHKIMQPSLKKGMIHVRENGDNHIVNILNHLREKLFPINVFTSTLWQDCKTEFEKEKKTDMTQVKGNEGRTIILWMSSIIREKSIFLLTGRMWQYCTWD